MLGLMHIIIHIISNSTGSATHAAPETLCLRHLRIKVNHVLQTAVDLGLISRRKVVSTDASNMVWEALCEGRPTSRLLVEHGEMATYQLK